MAVWLVRAGKHGERQEFALDNGVAVIGWQAMSDLSKFKSRDELREECLQAYPGEKPKAAINWAGQLWSFAHAIKKDDLVVLPLKGQNAIAIGKVTGGYSYKPSNPEGAKHTLPVKWIAPDMPRNRFDQDLLYSMGAFITVCQISRNNAEARIRGILEGKKVSATPEPPAAEEPTEEPEGTPDLVDVALTQIKSYISEKYSGHRLANLVEAVLRAQGYETEVATPGSDGGVDIVAGQGPMGFGSPRLLVQVKSGDQQQDVKVVRELQGVMKQFNADHGLFVAWGGFKRTVYQEQRSNFFTIRLWDAGDLVEAILKNYDAFPEDIKADLPLKRIWTLVLEE